MLLWKFNIRNIWNFWTGLLRVNCPKPGYIIKFQIFLKYYFLQRIKSNQIQKLLREEKEVLAEQVATLQTQVEAQMLVVRNLEEKEQVLQNALSTAEKELG